MDGLVLFCYSLFCRFNDRSNRELLNRWTFQLHAYTKNIKKRNGLWVGLRVCKTWSGFSASLADIFLFLFVLFYHYCCCSVVWVIVVCLFVCLFFLLLTPPSDVMFRWRVSSISLTSIHTKQLRRMKCICILTCVVWIPFADDIPQHSFMTRHFRCQVICLCSGLLAVRI